MNGVVVAVVAKFDALVASLSVESPAVDLLVEVGRALAWEIDSAGDGEKPRSVSAAARALQSLSDDLIAKGCVSGRSDEAEADWSKPAAVADLAKVRDAKKPRAGNVRARGVGGGAAAS